MNMYKQDFVLNNQQWLICHETKPNLNYSWYHLELELLWSYILCNLPK